MKFVADILSYAMIKWRRALSCLLALHLVLAQ